MTDTCVYTTYIIFRAASCTAALQASVDLAVLPHASLMMRVFYNSLNFNVVNSKSAKARGWYDGAPGYDT